MNMAQLQNKAANLHSHVEMSCNAAVCSRCATALCTFQLKLRAYGPVRFCRSSAISCGPNLRSNTQQQSSSHVCQRTLEHAGLSAWLLWGAVSLAEYRCQSAPLLQGTTAIIQYIAAGKAICMQITGSSRTIQQFVDNFDVCNFCCAAEQ